MTTTTETRVHIDRSGPFDFNGLEWADTACDPIALWAGDGWDLFIYGEDGPLMLGGRRDMTDAEVQELAREALAD